MTVIICKYLFVKQIKPTVVSTVQDIFFIFAGGMLEFDPTK